MNKKIAIIDDEISILDVLQRFLSRSEKLEIEIYENPLEALASVQSGKYDLILLDIMMPQMDGLLFLDQVKGINPNQKVIMMTASSTIDRMIHANAIGADDYVTKPFISLRDVENKVLDNLGL